MGKSGEFCANPKWLQKLYQEYQNWRRISKISFDIHKISLGEQKSFLTSEISSFIINFFADCRIILWKFLEVIYVSHLLGFVQLLQFSLMYFAYNESIHFDSILPIKSFYVFILVPQLQNNLPEADSHHFPYLR